MSRRPFSRLPAWVFVGALLLKSAIPILASAAAGLQGRAVAEICDVYGVDTAPAAAASRATASSSGAHAHHHHDDAAHAAAAHDAHGHDGDASQQPAPARGHGAKSGDHCVLSGMVAIVGGDALALARPASIPTAAPAMAAGDVAVFDAVARWAALLEHGPPALS